jgi:hypothetical protein
LAISIRLRVIAPIPPTAKGQTSCTVCGAVGVADAEKHAKAMANAEIIFFIDILENFVWLMNFILMNKNNTSEQMVTIFM